MKSIYNKGKYRNGEWGKISPFLKKTGNRKFRRTARIDIEEHTNEIDIIRSPSKRRNPKMIKVRYTLRLFCDLKLTRIGKYRNLKDAYNAINRPNVIRFVIISNKSNDP